MKLDAHSKHGVLTGWLHLIAYTIFAIDPIVFAIKYVNYDEYGMPYGYFLQALGFLFMATLSGLLIFGVVKKRHLFIAPWLVCTTIGLIAIVGIVIVQCFTEFRNIFFVLEQYIYLFGMQILILYPIYNLYCNIREYSKKVVYSQNIKYSNNLQQNSCDTLDNTEKKQNKDILAQKFQV